VGGSRWGLPAFHGASPAVALRQSQLLTTATYDTSVHEQNTASPSSVYRPSPL
jgi:hypothetical protein